MQFIYKERYVKRFDHFPRKQQLLIHETDRQIRAAYQARQAPFGLRIKHLHTVGSDKIFEARVSQAIRIVWAERNDAVSFLLVGLHDEVKRYLRSTR